jgi:predicted dehydrogenase/threonine dehydrogenase-like Zn-dependent dehydrogenase
MKQVLQNLATGVIEIADVPNPAAAPGQVLVRTRRSLISSGTERMLTAFGKASLLGKARQQPDKVKAVLARMRTDGVLRALDTVRDKLDQPLPLGYCNVGRVQAVGPGVCGLLPGDRVACNGAHAEVVSVPARLCVRVPDEVSDDQAAFTVVGAIALQGIRLLQPTLGEAIVVTGLGLIGQLAVRLLQAQGCRVLGIDVDPARLEIARNAGAEVVPIGSGVDPIALGIRFSRGRGVDGVLITAAARSSGPIHQAAQLCRTRGRIVMVGVAGLKLSREDFFRKEISFQVSRSYGAGRYDARYEGQGDDYPVGYVRWTAQRNFEAVLDLMADGRLRVEPLVSHRLPFEHALTAYGIVAGHGPSLGMLLEYPGAGTGSVAPVGLGVAPVEQRTNRCRAGWPAVAFIGAGRHATAALIPTFKAAGARLATIASRGGVSAAHAGRRFGFRDASTDTNAVLGDSSVEAVVIATRHDSHASLVVQALNAGKSVFVEKPLCLTLDELARIEAAYASAPSPLLMVGFNRRFAPHVKRIKALLAGTGPKSFVMTVNAGAVPADHWIQDRQVGGGRVVGESCHFIDLLRFLAGCPIASARRVDAGTLTGDTLTINLTFADGSIGTIHYFANGSGAFAKERLEVFADGIVLQLDNFRKLTGFGAHGFRAMRLWRQDKGHGECATAFVDALRAGAPSPIPFEEIIEVARTTLAIA